MHSAANILKNNNLAALQRQAAPEIVSAIRKASVRTGVDFAYLMEKASAESSFRTDAKAKTSSATGLFQFIEKTWLMMVRDHGEKYGLGNYAEKISAHGKVADAKTRQEILDLRKNPETAAAMAAEYAANNKEYLESRVNKEIGAVELYLAHFLGPSGAAGFLKAMEKNPLETAADIFPAASRANRNVFYDSKTGQPRTLAGIYDFFAKKFENSGSESDTETMLVAEAEQPRTAGSLSGKDLWAHELFRDTQAQQLRLLAGRDEQEDDNRMAGNRLAKLGQRAGNRQALVVSPLQIMELAQLDTPRARPRYNE